jgi:hypothetical protein
MAVGVACVLRSAAYLRVRVLGSCFNSICFVHSCVSSCCCVHCCFICDASKLFSWVAAQVVVLQQVLQQVLQTELPYWATATYLLYPLLQIRFGCMYLAEAASHINNAAEHCSFGGFTTPCVHRDFGSLQAVCLLTVEPSADLGAWALCWDMFNVLSSWSLLYCKGSNCFMRYLRPYLLARMHALYIRRNLASAQLSIVLKQHVAVHGYAAKGTSLGLGSAVKQRSNNGTISHGVRLRRKSGVWALLQRGAVYMSLGFCNCVNASMCYMQ